MALTSTIVTDEPVVHRGFVCCTAQHMIMGLQLRKHQSHGVYACETHDKVQAVFQEFLLCHEYLQDLNSLNQAHHLLAAIAAYVCTVIEVNSIV